MIGKEGSMYPEKEGVSIERKKFTVNAEYNAILWMDDWFWYISTHNIF